MAIRTHLFNHTGAPILTKGMTLAANGVSAPPLQTIGVLNAFSSADGSFTDAFGLGQMDSDSSGYLYVADTSNNRVQRFSKNASGAWVYDSKCSSLNALGSNITMPLVAIDRARGQIHLASSAQNVTGTLVGVWSLASWPTLTLANRVRSYGTASGSNGSGNLRAPLALTLIGDYAVLCSSAGDYRVIKYNHMTGDIVAEDTNSLWKARFAANEDGSKYYSGAQATDTEIGLWRMNPSTLVGVSRLDYTTGGTYVRRGSLQQSSGGDSSDLVHYDGRIYVRGFSDGRIQAWETTADSFSDEFILAGGMGVSDHYGAASGYKPSNIQQMKIGISLGLANQSDDLIAWASNAQNTSSQQSFLLVWPVSIATATWTKSDWSEGTNTLLSLLPIGQNLAGEKYKIRLRKNAESWITFNADTLDDAGFLASVGTFTQGDVLTIELSLSTHNRLDFHGTLRAARDKLSPSGVRIILSFNDSLGDVYIAEPTSYLAGEIGADAAIEGWVSP